jgi:hypothetical protein
MSGERKKVILLFDGDEIPLECRILRLRMLMIA